MDPKIKAMLEAAFGTSEEEAVLEAKTKDGITQVRSIPAKVVKVKLTDTDCKKLCKKVGLSYKDGYEERVFQFTMTDETVDRYGDIVKAKGADTKNYNSNPIILAFHNSHWFPVGLSIRTFYDSAANDVKGWVLIFDKQIDDTGFSDTLFGFVANGAVKTGSIGFLPKEWRYPDEKEQEELGMPRYGVMYEKWELLEFSIVPLPANPSATMKELAHASAQKVAVIEEIEGKLTAEELKTIQMVDVLAIEEQISKMGLGFVRSEEKDSLEDLLKEFSVLASQLKDIEDTPPPETLKGEELEATPVIDDDTKELLKTLIVNQVKLLNKQILLIDKLDLVASTMERAAITGLTPPDGQGEPASGGDGEKDGEAETLYTQEALDEIENNAIKTIEALGKE